jgi:hypothetical protein
MSGERDWMWMRLYIIHVRTNCASVTSASLFLSQTAQTDNSFVYTASNRTSSRHRHPHPKLLCAAHPLFSTVQTVYKHHSTVSLHNRLSNSLETLDTVATCACLGAASRNETAWRLRPVSKPRHSARNDSKLLFRL